MKVVVTRKEEKLRGLEKEERGEKKFINDLSKSIRKVTKFSKGTSWFQNFQKTHSILALSLPIKILFNPFYFIGIRVIIENSESSKCHIKSALSSVLPIP